MYRRRVNVARDEVRPMKLTADERVAYLQAVWDAFQTKAQISRDWSSAEYHVAARWLDQGIPLFVVLRAVQDFNGRPRRLGAVEQPVANAVAYWRQAIGL